MKKPALWVVVLCLVAAISIYARQEWWSSRTAAGTSECAPNVPSSLSLRCISFSGHLYAVAQIDLRKQKILFTASADGKKETFPEVVRNLSHDGIAPLLVTNAGIYGTDNRPLGLLISPKGKDT